MVRLMKLKSMRYGGGACLGQVLGEQVEYKRFALLSKLIRSRSPDAIRTRLADQLRP